MKDENPGWKKSEPVDRFYIKYGINKKLSTHEAILPNHRKISSRHVQALSVSPTRITRTSLIHRKSYCCGNLDWDILGLNMCNG